MSNSTNNDEVDVMLNIRFERPEMLSPSLASLEVPIDSNIEEGMLSFEDYMFKISTKLDKSLFKDYLLPPYDDTFFSENDYANYSASFKKFQIQWNKLTYKTDNNRIEQQKSVLSNGQPEHVTSTETQTTKASTPQNTMIEQKQSIKTPTMSMPPPPPRVFSIQSALPTTPSITNKYSSLSAQEHKEYMALRNKFLAVDPKTGKNQLTEAGSKRYFQLRTKVQQEQKEYKKTLFDEAMKEKEKFFYIDSKILENVDQILSKKGEFVKKFPQFYRTQKIVDLKTIVAAKDDPVLTKPEPLLQIGKCYTFDEKKFQVGVTKLPLDRIVHQNLIKDVPPNYWYKKVTPSIQEDSAIASIIQTHKIDFVMTDETITSLIDVHAPSYKDEFFIPFMVKQMGNHTTILLDKPFLKKKYSVREKNEIFYNCAFKSYGLDTRPETPVIDFNKDNPHVERNKELLEKCDNLIYTIWTLGEFKILIRSKHDGVMPDSTTSVGYRFLGLQVKPEFQIPKGLEEITMNEYARWWIQAYLNNVKLYICRVNVKDHTVMQMEARDIQTIIPPGCPFKPQQAIKVLFVVLNEMTSLQIGSYLLSHTSGQSQILIQQAVEKGDFDLYEEFKNCGTTDKQTVHYIPIMWIPKPNQIPFTFPIEEGTRKRRRRQRNVKQKRQKSENL